MKRLLVLCFIAALVFGTMPAMADTKSYGDITLSGGFQAGHFPEFWEQTGGDMVISFTYDGNGLVDDLGGSAHAWGELGVRSPCYGDFNPTSGVEGAGVWLATDYEWVANTFDPDPPGAPTLDLDDKLILQKGGGLGEGSYNLPSTPPTPGNNHRIWFDRDGVDSSQALNPLAFDGDTYNTGGIYEIVITLHVNDATSGTAYMTINGLDQGFETNNDWTNMEVTPAGMTFTGDMEHLQVFYGMYGYGATHTVSFEYITVEGQLGNPYALCSEKDIDIKPGSYPNSINLQSRGVVSVAVLTTDSFDATTVDPVTVTFADASPVRWSTEDVDGDGDLDLVFKFKTQELNLDENSTDGILQGQTFDPEFFWGADSVNIVP